MGMQDIKIPDPDALIKAGVWMGIYLGLLFSLVGAAVIGLIVAVWCRWGPTVTITW